MFFGSRPHNDSGTFPLPPLVPRPVLVDPPSLRSVLFTRNAGPGRGEVGEEGFVPDPDVFSSHRPLEWDTSLNAGAILGRLLHGVDSGHVEAALRRTGARDTNERPEKVLQGKLPTLRQTEQWSRGSRINSPGRRR